MQTFKQYISEGRSTGEDMEEAIVGVWNGTYDTEYMRQGAEKVVEFLKMKGVTGKAEVLGASQLQVSSKWSEYWKPDKVPAATKTPKTDIKIGRYKISLKSGPSAQLMSGGRNESRATFYTAVDKVGVVEDKFVKPLEDMVNNLAPSSVAASNLDQAIKDAKDKAVMTANAAHKLFKTDLQSYFNTNPDFADAFAYEAMSGEVKFGGNEGTADWFLTTSWDGNKVNFVPTSDKDYVSHVARKMNPSVRFKTTSVKKRGVKTGEYRYWSVVGLIVNKLDEGFAPYEGQVLTEGILDKVKGMIRGLVSFVKKLFLKIKRFVKKSYRNLIEFLEFEPEMSVNTNVKF